MKDSEDPNTSIVLFFQDLLPAAYMCYCCDMAGDMTLTAPQALRQLAQLVSRVEGIGEDQALRMLKGRVRMGAKTLTLLSHILPRSVWFAACALPDAANLKSSVIARLRQGSKTQRAEFATAYAQSFWKLGKSFDLHRAAGDGVSQVLARRDSVTQMLLLTEQHRRLQSALVAAGLPLPAASPAVAYAGVPLKIGVYPLLQAVAYEVLQLKGYRLASIGDLYARLGFRAPSARVLRRKFIRVEATSYSGEDYNVLVSTFGPASRLTLLLLDGNDPRVRQGFQNEDGVPVVPALEDREASRRVALRLVYLDGILEGEDVPVEARELASYELVRYFHGFRSATDRWTRSLLFSTSPDS